MIKFHCQGKFTTVLVVLMSLNVLRIIQRIHSWSFMRRNKATIIRIYARLRHNSDCTRHTRTLSRALVPGRMHRYMHGCAKRGIERLHWKRGEVLRSARERHGKHAKRERCGLFTTVAVSVSVPVPVGPFRSCHVYRSWKSEPRFASFTACRFPHRRLASRFHGGPRRHDDGINARTLDDNQNEISDSMTWGLYYHVTSHLPTTSLPDLLV